MILQNLILSIKDPGTKDNSKLSPIKESTEVVDFELLLSNRRTVKVSDVVKNGPLLLIFIRGTWCPFCRLHLGKLRSWVQKLDKTNATIIVVSSEPVEDINNWLTKNSSTYLFASDASKELGDYFGVRILPNTFMQAATFLIDKSMKVTLAYVGKRSKENFEQVTKTIG